eukprot:Blabericola_migrator_1__2435@NODE_1686_length_4002_cov_81_866582_g1093_i0_p3_GENE_NODE_1686_length_4002_cov_81_866582_g1093_i0NODE_1686_length_4002_cov_81_866582_g1093_i0_p3_ORF_typecomplete_len225_score24_41Ferritin_2/PF13668_6/9_6e16Ferritin_2/PF13668_6/2_6e03_NODE_1686_length_4002_cov_81_866582_g1093_i014122086
MRQQEVGHAARIQYFMGNPIPAQPCIYNFPYRNVAEFLRLARTVTAVGEAYYLGFMHLLDNCESQQAAETIVVNEAVQHALFRAWSGVGPFGGTSFFSALTARQAWTLSSPMVMSCPATNPPLHFQAFPGLEVRPIAGGQTAPPGTLIHFSATHPGSFDPRLANYAAFITETGVQATVFDPSTMTARVPQTAGVVFVALARTVNSGYQLDDDQIIAGPAALTVS